MTIVIYKIYFRLNVVHFVKLFMRIYSNVVTDYPASLNKLSNKRIMLYRNLLQDFNEITPRSKLMQGYNLAEGRYENRTLSEDEMWSAFSNLFSAHSKNSSSYKFGFLKSLGYGEC